MKKGGILNPALTHLVTSLGHTDWVTISDRGYPIPESVTRVDLALTDDIPTVLQVLDALDQEFVIDRIIVAEEMVEASSERWREIVDRFPRLTIKRVPHLELKELTRQGKGVVRTGDTCPYANLIVVSG